MKEKEIKRIEGLLRLCKEGKVCWINKKEAEALLWESEFDKMLTKGKSIAELWEEDEELINRLENLSLFKDKAELDYYCAFLAAKRRRIIIEDIKEQKLEEV